MDSTSLFPFNQAGGVPIQFMRNLEDFVVVERFF
jgi:hypothetical protein